MRGGHGGWLAVVLSVVAASVLLIVPPGDEPIVSAAVGVEEKVAVDIGVNGGNVCAVTVEGEQWCWGENWDGGLANGTGGQSSYEDNPALTPVRSTGGGYTATSGRCNIGAGGAVSCWGGAGIIEDGDGSLFSDPAWGRTTPGSYGHAPSVAVERGCSLTTVSTVQCYGWNAYGELGNGSPSWAGSGYPLNPPFSATAVTVALTDVVDLGHLCAVKDDGTVWCWGSNFNGELGDGGAAVHADSPVQIPGIDDAVSTESRCALREGGKVSCWGRNRGQQLAPAGDPNASLGPVEIAAFEGAVDVSVDSNSACAVFADGSVSCRGSGAVAGLDIFGPGGHRAVEIDSSWAGGHCVRTQAGAVACFGTYGKHSGVGIDGFERLTGPQFVVGFEGGPTVEAEVRFVHADPENESDTFAFGEEFFVTLRVSVFEAQGGAAVLEIPGKDELFDDVTQLEVLESPIEDEGITDRLGALQFRDYTWKVKAVQSGEVTLEATIEGVDGFGDPMSPVDVVGETSVEPLKITVEADPDKKNFTVDELPAPVTVTVTIENISADDVDNVTLQGWLDWSPLHDDEILPDVNLEFVDPEEVERAFGNGQFVDLGTVKPGVANAVTYQYDLLATERAHAELKQLVTATQFGEQFNTLATSEVRLGGMLLEFESRPTSPVRGSLLDAGQAIRIEGTITNLADFDIEVGPPPPKVDGNAGAMSVVWDPRGELPEPQDTVVPGIRVLEPGESVDFLVRITTQWSDPRTYGAERHGGTRAYVEFTPWGRYPDPEDEVAPFDYIYFETERMLTDESELKHTISIDDSIEIPEFDALDFTAGVFVGTVEGFGHAAVGIVTGIIETPYAVYSTMRAIYEFIEKVWGSFSPEEHEAFKQSVAFATYQFLLRSAEFAKQTYDEVKPQIDAMLTQAFTEMANKWETGDYVGATKVYARYAGELIGSIMIPIALAKLAKTPQAVAAAQRAQAAIQRAAIPVLQAARNTRFVDDLYRSVLALKSGTILIPDDVQRLFGITPDELAEFQRIADDLNYLITVRSRHVSSNTWIKELKAMVKPEALKIKSVNELDIRLGYDAALIEGRQPLGALVFKKPEPLIRWDNGGETGEIGQYVRDFVQSKGFTPDTPDYEAALDRTYLRMKEWRKFEDKYKRFDREGLEVTYNYEGNQIPADVRSPETKYLGFDLQDVPGQPETYIVRLMDDTGRFRPVTGDIDAIAFTKADGSPLTAREHADLLDRIRENPKLAGQHGETATFDPPGSGLGGLRIIASQFKPNEPGLQIMPNTDGARVVRFNPDKSRWASARDYNLHWDGGYVEISRKLLTGAARPFQITVPALEIADATDEFVLEASRDGEPNLGRCTVSISDAAPNAQSVFGGDGGLFELLTDGSVQPSPLGDQCFGEGDPIDVVLRSASELSSVFGANNFSPNGELVRHGAGATVLPLDDPSGFNVGEVIAIGAGTPNVEMRTIVSTDPLRIDSAPSKSHSAGDLVVVLVGVAEASLVPVEPARVFETRVGESTVDGRFEGVGRLGAGSTTEIEIAGRGGVGDDAVAVALNVTAIGPSDRGFVTLFPCDADRPTTSSLNYGAGAVAGNSAIVKLSATGTLCIFSRAATDLVIDVNAWLAPSLAFESLVPARLTETRAGESTDDGQFEAIGRLAAGSVTAIQIAGRGGVSSDADAIALNVTAINPSDRGFITLFACDADRPTSSSLNYAAGAVVGNSGVVSLSADGTLCVFTRSATDLVIDVNAWMSADSSFSAFVPARLFETRTGEDTPTIDGDGRTRARLAAGSVTAVPIAGRGDVPDAASAVAVNVTAVGPSDRGFVTLFPCDGDRPLASSLNYGPGAVVGNSGVVKLSAAGELCVFTRAETDLVIDVNAAWN